MHALGNAPATKRGLTTEENLEDSRLKSARTDASGLQSEPALNGAILLGPVTGLGSVMSAIACLLVPFT